LELTLSLIEACPARLPQLFFLFGGYLSFSFKRLGGVLALSLSPKPSKPGHHG
jgi:hypothetical protein